jgi:WD40 repeat protein
MLISGAMDGSICIWEMPLPTTSLYDSHGILVHHRCAEYFLHLNAVLSLDILSDLQKAVSCSSDGKVKYWSVTDGQEKDVTVNDKPICVKALNHGQWAIGCDSGMIRIFDAANILSEIQLASGVLTLAVTNDFSRIVASYGTNHVAVIQPGSWELLSRFEAHENRVTGLCITGDRMLVTVGNEGRVSLWDLMAFEKIEDIRPDIAMAFEATLCCAANTAKHGKYYFVHAGSEGRIQVFVQG